MELKIYSPQDAGFIQKIDWNFEELKQEISVAAQEYAASVYTDETIKSAKDDRAKLNKFMDALKSKRTEIRKKLLEPDELFGAQVNELIGIVQAAAKNIDDQVKDYEKRQRDEKIAKVREFYEDNIGDLAPYLPFERVFRTEYANQSTSMKTIKEGILGTIQKVAEGLAILNEVESKFAGDMKEEFLRSYDIGAAMQLRNRLEAEEQRRAEYESEQQRKKAEREAGRKAETARVMQAGQQKKTDAQITRQEQPQPPVMETVEEPVHMIDFRVWATVAQLNDLKAFLKENGIQYGPVPK